jgi:glycosyltransferase involved in cell wall biosynthesis
MVGATTALRVQLISKPGSRATGIGRYSWEIERGLRESGVDVVSAPLKDTIPGAVSAIARKVGYDLDAFARSYPLRAAVQPGRITHLTSQTLATLLLTQRLPRPVVVTVHDILPYLLRDDPELSVYRHRLDRTMDSLAMRGLKHADRLIADSAFTRQTLIDELGIDGSRIDVVHLGVDTSTFKPMTVPGEFLRRYRLAAGTPYALFVGSEDPRKDLPTLLRAMAIVRESRPEIELIKVGAAAFGDQRERHLALSRKLGISDAVHWIDAVPESDLPLFYNLAKVFAFPSRYEGFGLPVLEALACGTPVVAADASSVPELTGDTATLVVPRNPGAMAAGILEALASDKDCRQNRVIQASGFSWAGTLAATLCSYRTAGGCNEV